MAYTDRDTHQKKLDGHAQFLVTKKGDFAVC